MKDNEYFFIMKRNTRTKLIYVSAVSREMAFEKAILKYRHLIKTKIEKMDLVTARERASKASATSKKTYYIILESDGECTVGTAPLNGAIHKFVNGEEYKAFKPKMVENVEDDNGIEAPVKTSKNRRLIKKDDVNLSHQKAEIDAANDIDNETEKTQVMEKSTAPKKRAKKATKKVASKKAAKKAAKKSAQPAGVKKTLTIEAIMKLQKAGKRVYRASVEYGGLLIAERVAKVKDKKRTMEVIVKD